MHLIYWISIYQSIQAFLNNISNNAILNHLSQHSRADSHKHMFIYGGIKNFEIWKTKMLIFFLICWNNYTQQKRTFFKNVFETSFVRYECHSFRNLVIYKSYIKEGKKIQTKASVDSFAFPLKKNTFL